MLEILIDLTCLSYRVTGLERYAMCISEEMIKNDKINRYKLVFRDNTYPLFEQYVDNDRVKSYILHGDHKQFFNLITRPLELKKIDADCYLFFAGRNPLLFSKKKIYNTIHDLVCWDYPETQRTLQRMYSRIANRYAARISEKIFTVSAFSKSRIHQLLNVPNDNIVVTYNGISDSFNQCNKKSYDEIKAKYNLPDQFIMNLSTIEPRKNLSLLLKCFDSISDRVDYDIVLVGRKGWKIDELLNEIRANSRIHITGYVEDDEVAEIYKHAMCFVFPSLYEGFGIPPIEALSMGTPVISSDSSCMKEVLRDQAVFFKNNDEEELKALLLKLPEMYLTMPRKLDDYQIDNFNYRKSAQKVLSTISQ